MRSAFAFACALALGVADTGRAASTGDERARVAEERAAIEARFQSRDVDCRQRFVVSSCVEEARRERRLGLDGLKSRERLLDEQSRLERTRAKQAELAARAEEDARREAERASRAASVEARSETRVEAKGAAAERAAERAASTQGKARPTRTANAERSAQRRAGEADARAAFEARQRKAEQHRRDVEEKTARRLEKRARATASPSP